MSQYFSFGYWFDLYPNSWQQAGKIFIYLNLFFLVVGLLIKIYFLIKSIKGVWRKTGQKLSTLFITLSIIGIGYWFMREQLVPFFSSRFWLLLLIITLSLWLSLIVRYFFKKLREEKQNLERAAIYGKYLPGQK